MSLNATANVTVRQLLDRIQKLEWDNEELKRLVVTHENEAKQVREMYRDSTIHVSNLIMTAHTQNHQLKKLEEECAKLKEESRVLVSGHLSNS